MTTYEYIINKYKLRVGHQYIVDVPNMGRNTLAELFAELDFKKGVEVGVDRGEYSEVLCKANPQAKVFGVDPWIPEAYEPNTYVNEPEEYFNKNYKETVDRMVPYKNYKLIRKTSVEAMEDFKDESLDFVYIDANHAFVDVATDVHGWKKKVKMGGILAGHDFAPFSSGKFNHVKRVVETYSRCYRMIPLFIAGNYEVRPGEIRDKYRSWFWVKDK